MGMSTMLVRFPDGSVKFGSYQNTADIGNPFLGDNIDEAREMYRQSSDVTLPTEGDTIEVEVYISYGGGTHGKMDARGGHLTNHAYYVTQCGGWGADLPPTMRDIQDGEPDWVAEVYRTLMGEPDEYCETTPDGDCVSKDPRCMHQPRQEPNHD